MALLKSKPERLTRPAPPALLNGLLNPRPGENILLFCEAGSGTTAAHTESTAARFLLAENWRLGLQGLGAMVPGVITLPAITPGQARIPDTSFRSALEKATCAVVFCEHHAPGAWRTLLADYPNLRLAVLPGASRQTEETSFSAEPPEVTRRLTNLGALLARSLGMRIQFSTGQQAYFDLRFQKPGTRLPTCHAGQSDRLAFLPGGEVWTSTYAGDGVDPWCDTVGIIPFHQNGLLYQYFIERGRIMDVIGDGAQADRYRKWLETHPEHLAVTRLGFGCNARASSLRNRLEARTAGFYWSIDPSPDVVQLTEPDLLSGQPPLDYHYTQGQPVVATEVTLTLDDTTEVTVAENGRVVV